jgi:hypothetical protein
MPHPDNYDRQTLTRPQNKNSHVPKQDNADNYLRTDFQHPQHTSHPDGDAMLTTPSYPSNSQFIEGGGG